MRYALAFFPTSTSTSPPRTVTCFSETITNTMGDEVGEVNSTNIPSIAASSARHDASIFTAAQNLNFTIANSQFVDVHGNYSVVCDHCAGVNVHIHDHDNS